MTNLEAYWDVTNGILICFSQHNMWIVVRNYDAIGRVKIDGICTADWKTEEMCFKWTAYLLPLYCLSHFVFSNRPELLYSSTLTVFFRRGRFSGKQNILLHIAQSNFSQRTHSTPFALPDVPANWLENVKNLEFVVTKGKDDVFQCFIDKNEPTKSVSLWLALALQLHNS